MGSVDNSIIVHSNDITPNHDTKLVCFDRIYFHGLGCYRSNNSGVDGLSYKSGHHLPNATSAIPMPGKSCPVMTQHWSNAVVFYLCFFHLNPPLTFDVTWVPIRVVWCLDCTCRTRKFSWDTHMAWCCLVIWTYENQNGLNIHISPITNFPTKTNMVLENIAPRKWQRWNLLIESLVTWTLVKSPFLFFSIYQKLSIP